MSGDRTSVFWEHLTSVDYELLPNRYQADTVSISFYYCLLSRMNFDTNSNNNGKYTRIRQGNLLSFSLSLSLSFFMENQNGW